MKIDADCVLGNGKEVKIIVDLDYIETINDVYAYINNKAEAFGSYISELKNEAEIEAFLENDADFNEAIDVISCGKMLTA